MGPQGAQSWSDHVPELRQLLLILRIQSESGLLIDNDSRIKPSATEHHDSLHVGIYTKNTLWGPRWRQTEAGVWDCYPTAPGLSGVW